MRSELERQLQEQVATRGTEPAVEEKKEAEAENSELENTKLELANV